jgi:PTH1 family peptidyl-tRNA hydrolase
MKFLLVGLGNIGAEYENTRHNIGFKVLDALAESSIIFFSPDRYASVATLKSRGRTFILVKPSTYMNLSGKAVNYWLQKEKLTADKLLVITDDLALPFGKLRMRGKGSDGGHNGLKNINQLLGHQNYARLRFGVGDNFHKGQQIDYVLSSWNSEEEKTLSERIKLAAEASIAFGTMGLGQTMSKFNGL